MRDKGWTVIVIGVDRASQFDLIDLAGEPLNAFYIERSVGLKRLVPAVIHRMHEIDRFRIRQALLIKPLILKCVVPDYYQGFVDACLSELY